MKIILAFLSVIGIFLLVGGILFTAGAMLIGDECGTNWVTVLQYP